MTRHADVKEVSRRSDVFSSALNGAIPVWPQGMTREAVDVQSTLLGPYERLSSQLKRAKVAETFIAAARNVLELRATDFVGASTITDSAAVRARLVREHAYTPETLAAKVHDAAQYVINQATTLADKIDVRQNFSFSYSTQFQAAADALNDYATKVEGDVTEAVNTVIGVT